MAEQAQPSTLFFEIEGRLYMRERTYPRQIEFLDNDQIGLMLRVFPSVVAGCSALPESKADLIAKRVKDCKVSVHATMRIYTDIRQDNRKQFISGLSRLLALAQQDIRVINPELSDKDKLVHISVVMAENSLCSHGKPSLIFDVSVAKSNQTFAAYRCRLALEDFTKHMSEEAVCLQAPRIFPLKDYVFGT